VLRSLTIRREEAITEPSPMAREGHSESGVGRDSDRSTGDGGDEPGEPEVAASESDS
jgi:small subunit ribosomal protein S6